jgi:hypothetical protein
LKNYRQRLARFLREYALEVVIGATGLALVNGIFIAKAFRQSTTVDPEAAGQLGAFVGGFVGAIFALIGVVLLFATLRRQQRAFALQSFENKYFELIKMHRDNVAELSLPGATGRKVFVLLVREFRCALDIVRQSGDTHNQQLTQREALQIAYYCLFFGVGPNSSRMLKISLSTFDPAFIETVEKEFNRSELKKEIQEKRRFEYLPFEGHQSRLGHYYRHLYQMVKYVHQRPIDIDKYEYVKTIRAQLSTHEQALLLVNSLTPIGQNWWKNELITKYRMVQNIPRDFFNSLTEIDTEKLFTPDYFEWEEASHKHSAGLA